MSKELFMSGALFVCSAFVFLAFSGIRIRAQKPTEAHIGG